MHLQITLDTSTVVAACNTVDPILTEAIKDTLGSHQPQRRAMEPVAVGARPHGTCAC